MGHLLTPFARQRKLVQNPAEACERRWAQTPTPLAADQQTESRTLPAGENITTGKIYRGNAKCVTHKIRVDHHGDALRTQTPCDCVTDAVKTPDGI